MNGLTVRRLTPLECERLQGFPDGWTDIPWKGKKHAPDSPRYKALGNSMAVAAAAIFIVFCVCTWEEVTTARTIIMRDGNQSYACTVSDISLAPHDCNPIEDAK